MSEKLTACDIEEIFNFRDKVRILGGLLEWFDPESSTIQVVGEWLSKSVNNEDLVQSLDKLREHTGYGQ